MAKDGAIAYLQWQTDKKSHMIDQMMPLFKILRACQFSTIRTDIQYYGDIVYPSYSLSISHTLDYPFA